MRVQRKSPARPLRGQPGGWDGEAEGRFCRAVPAFPKGSSYCSYNLKNTTVYLEHSTHNPFPLLFTKKSYSSKEKGSSSPTSPVCHSSRHCPPGWQGQDSGLGHLPSLLGGERSCVSRPHSGYKLQALGTRLLGHGCAGQTLLME